MGVFENIKALNNRIDEICQKCGRNRDEITLIAVTKTKPISLLKEAQQAGEINFGENRPQEIVKKYPELDGIKWHLIGQLQKNKVKHIIDKTELIHSVDSLSLALEIDKRAGQIDKVQDILIQVNITKEESKSGVYPEDAEAVIREISVLKNVRIKGLMTISKKEFDVESNKNTFRKLRELSEKIDALNIENVSMKELSMGMTNDFEEALSEGATIIRVGTAIFGAREM